MSAAPGAVVAPAEFFARPREPQLSDFERMQRRLANSGELREVIEVDRSGRRISRFVGDIDCWLSPFKHPGKLVTGWPSASR